jgi:hypothetical protein
MHWCVKRRKRRNEIFQANFRGLTLPGWFGHPFFRILSTFPLVLATLVLAEKIIIMPSIWALEQYFQSGWHADSPWPFMKQHQFLPSLDKVILIIDLPHRCYYSSLTGVVWIHCIGHILCIWWLIGEEAHTLLNCQGGWDHIKAI